MTGERADEITLPLYLKRATDLTPVSSIKTLRDAAEEPGVFWWRVMFIT